MKKSHIEYFEDGAIKVIGKLKDGRREGYWKWYRKDGTKLKTGFFKEGKLAKEVMKYNKKGKLIK